VVPKAALGRGFVLPKAALGHGVWCLKWYWAGFVVSKVALGRVCGA